MKVGPRYNNGEKITKDRMEDEDWYADYQSLLELSKKNSSVEYIANAFLTDYYNLFGKQYSNLERVLRWSVLQSALSYGTMT